MPGRWGLSSIRLLRRSKAPESPSARAGIGLPIAFGALILGACASSLDRTSEAVAFVGTVIDIHHLGSEQETVSRCGPDPGFVVVIRSADQERRLAIHSPALTFGSPEPLGRRYEFLLRWQENRCLLEVVREVGSGPATATQRPSRSKGIGER